MKKHLLIICGLFLFFSASAQTVIFDYGTSWKYLDNGTNQGTAWRALSFNDAAWKVGAAELGYGDGDETTVVSYGTNASKKYITTYFRKIISIANPASYSGFTLSLKRDDGAVVYINGTEVFRTNMPTGTISSSTKASTAVSDDGETPQVTNLPVSRFTIGNNVVAVEVHQNINTSSDLTFDLSLTATPVANQAPVANAGADQNILLPASSVILNGTGTDVDGTITTYAWAQISGPATTNFSSPAAVSTNVSGMTVAGTYSFRLTVTDNLNAIGSDIVDVIVAPVPVNQPPVANAGADQNITLPASSTTLTGSGTDAGGSVTAYVWSQLSGPATAVFSAPTSAVTGITGLIVAGTYTFQLTVTDNENATGSDIVSVIVADIPPNQPPVANAGIDQNIILPTSSVILNGTGTDAGGSVTGYTWSQLSGPATAVFATPGSASTNVTGLIVAGTYSFQLTVTDNENATGTDIVNVLVAVTPPNQPPVANAGIDQNITLPNSSVALSGSGTDVGGSIISYVWTQVSGPSTVSFTSASSASTSVTGMTSSGIYTLRLTVTDNEAATGSDDMTVTVNAVPSNTNILAFGTSWKYLDNGTNQGTAWSATGFNDATWASGNAQLGYGDGDEATVVSFGANSSSKYITTYFRKLINFTSPSSFTSVKLNIKRDDGVVVYVNGTEVYRNNMPTGTILNTTLASTAAADDGATIQTATLLTSAFVNGNNTIAVEIHQNAATSTDISFDMELIASVTTVALTRGPYLQMGNSSGVTLRWRSDIATDSRIEVGTSLGTYTNAANNATVSTEHEVRITGLLPDTKYYYRFGSTTAILQGATDNFFVTAPPVGVNRKIRVAVFGDCGRNDNGFQSGSLSAYQNYTGSSPAELMLLLGDNAYESGTDAEFTSNFFNAYSSNILKNHVLFPAPGNHDYANTQARQIDKNVPYYNIFTVPVNAESGGVASGTKAYYSYDWGNIHFLSLDSYGMETANNWRLYDTTSPQVQWIKNDLAANTRQWTIAYWHHPPYTMGSHNSDTEAELIAMRTNFIRILERNGVDMILCGHSHDYERSYLLKGYFGLESTFNVSTHTASSSSGKYDGTTNSCPYLTTAGLVNHGTVYVVAGSAGADGGVQAGYPHNALPFSVDDGGMFYFEVENNRLDAKFLNRNGTVADKFTIMKNVSSNQTVSISSGGNTTLTASWIGNYQWSNGANTRSITVSPLVTTAYSCTDGSGCVTDQFTVNIIGTVRVSNAMDLPVDKEVLGLYPMPVRRGEMLNVTSTGLNPLEVVMVNANGQIVRKLKFQGKTQISTSDLAPGLYIIKKLSAGKTEVKKILVLDR